MREYGNIHVTSGIRLIQGSCWIELELFCYFVYLYYLVSWVCLYRKGPSNIIRQFIVLTYVLKLHYIKNSDFPFILSWIWCGNSAEGEWFVLALSILTFSVSVHSVNYSGQHIYNDTAETGQYMQNTVGKLFCIYLFISKRA